MEQKKDEIFTKFFLNPIEKYGKITHLATFFSLFVPGLYLYFVHNVSPAPLPLLKSLISIWSFMIIIGIIEPIIYYPLLGFAGTYMSFLVGNILNLRVPVASTALQATNTKPNTDEANIILTIAIASSILSSSIVLMIGAFILLPYIQDIQGSGTTLEISLNNILPALFGALTVTFVLRTPKLAMIPLVLGVITAFLKKDLPYSIAIPPITLISILTARIMYKRGWITDVSTE